MATKCDACGRDVKKLYFEVKSIEFLKIFCCYACLAYYYLHLNRGCYNEKNSKS